MTKKIFIICAFCCLSLNTVTYAAVDEYGNEINWDVTAAGNEDHAGAEELEETDEVILESKRNNQTESESQQIEEILQETGSIAEKKGIINIAFSAPSNWGKHDIVLTIYNRSKIEKHEIELTKATGYSASAEISYGLYEVRGAYVKGDEVNAHPLRVDTYDFLLDDTTNHVSVNISPATETVVRLEDEKETSAKIGESTLSGINDTTGGGIETESPFDSGNPNNKNTEAEGANNIPILLIGSVLLIGGLAALIVLRKGSKR